MDHTFFPQELKEPRADPKHEELVELPSKMLAEMLALFELS